MKSAEPQSHFEQAKACYDKKEYSECLEFLRLSMKEGNVNAKRFYSRLMDIDDVFRETVERDYNLTAVYKTGVADGIKLGTPSSSEPQDAKAQFDLGNRYYMGSGVRKDYSEAVKWYRLAAEQGHAASQYGLGECYYYGRGVGQNTAEAVKWYRKAAEQEDTASQYSLGYCYYSVRTV